MSKKEMRSSALLQLVLFVAAIAISCVLAFNVFDAGTTGRAIMFVVTLASAIGCSIEGVKVLRYMAD